MMEKVPRIIIFGNKDTTQRLPKSGAIDGTVQALIESEAENIAKLTGGVVAQRSDTNATIEVPYKGGKAEVYLGHATHGVNRLGGIMQEGVINVSADYTAGKTLELTRKLSMLGYGVPTIRV